MRKKFYILLAVFAALTGLGANEELDKLTDAQSAEAYCEEVVSRLLQMPGLDQDREPTDAEAEELFSYLLKFVDGQQYIHGYKDGKTGDHMLACNKAYKKGYVAGLLKRMLEYKKKPNKHEKRRNRN